MTLDYCCHYCWLLWLLILTNTCRTHVAWCKQKQHPLTETCTSKFDICKFSHKEFTCRRILNVLTVNWNQPTMQWKHLTLHAIYNRNRNTQLFVYCTQKNNRIEDVFGDFHEHCFDPLWSCFWFNTQTLVSSHFTKANPSNHSHSGKVSMKYGYACCTEQ